ncbi:MAG TPA: bifunctional phosphopantothenoylcysteine decarboxylase/phosphopantothenate--cysteine ligase CoaBC [Acidimicrobiia bacterium]
MAPGGADSVRGRNVLLCVSGGVAAYKAAYLARRLVENGAAVRVIMTASARRFLGEQTMAAITGSRPHTDLFDTATVSPHTDLAKWTDVVVIAPATAATMSRIASGLSEDLLTATVLASVAPIVVAPAMHTEMWEHPATQRNVATLAGDRVRIVGPATGALAGGDSGDGRMVEPDEILAEISRVLGPGDMEGLRVVVSAGGTREAIDPVRYIGNRSSGRMGAAIAAAASARGADVVLVTSAGGAGLPGIRTVEVESAEDMAEAVWANAEKADVVVMAAAVADFRPTGAAPEKLRRSEGPPDIRLEPTPDILAGVAAMEPRPFLVGFAAETGSIDAAVAKATSKGVDLLVANDVSHEGSGFGSPTNEVTIVTPDGATEPWTLMGKREVAERLWDKVLAMREPGRGGEGR